MNNLQTKFYVSFLVDQAEYKLILIDLMNLRRISRNVFFIKYLKEKKNRFPSGGEIYLYKEALREFLHSKNFNEPIKSLKQIECLHLNVVPNHEVFKKLNLEKKKKKKEIYLLAEKFFWTIPISNLGSGRHGLLFDMQIKGIGRNPLAVRIDHSHSWGGQYLWQTLKAYVVSHIFEGASPLGFLKTSYIAGKKEELEFRQQIRVSTTSLSLRESDALRVTQVMTQFDPNEKFNVSELVKKIFKSSGSRNLKEHIQKIYFHYAVLFLMGIRHSAITKENVTLEGKLIDYEDLELLNVNSIYQFYFTTQLNRASSTRGTQIFKGERLFTSTLHHYLDAVRLTLIGLKQIDPKVKMNESILRGNFLNTIKRLAKKCFNVDTHLIKTIEIFLKINSVYENVVDHEITKKKSILKLNKIFKSNKFEIINIQDAGNYMYKYYFAQFSRITLKNKFLEEFNRAKNSSVDNVTEMLYKMLQLEAFGEPISIEGMVNFSSKVNEYLSQNSLCFPYSLENGKIVLKCENYHTARKRLIKKIQFECNGSIIKLDEIRDKKNLIIKGAVVKTLNNENHYVTFKPILCKIP